MKTIKTLQYISLGLLMLTFLEGMMTFGSAFDFTTYNLFAWVVQIILCVAVISTAVRLSETEN